MSVPVYAPYYGPLTLQTPNNQSFTFGPATFRNPAGGLIDFSAATGKMQVRRFAADLVPILDFNVTAGTVLAFGGVLGTITATATLAAMAALQPGLYVWDLTVIIATVAIAWLAGTGPVSQGGNGAFFIITQGISR